MARGRASLPNPVLCSLPPQLSNAAGSGCTTVLPLPSPEEGDQLCGQRGNDDAMALALGRQSAKPLAQSELGFPGYVANLLGQLSRRTLDLSGYPGAYR